MQFLIAGRRMKLSKVGHHQKRKEGAEQQHTRQDVPIPCYLAVTEQQEQESDFYQIWRRMHPVAPLSSTYSIKY